MVQWARNSLNKFTGFLLILHHQGPTYTNTWTHFQASFPFAILRSSLSLTLLLSQELSFSCSNNMLLLSKTMTLTLSLWMSECIDTKLETNPNGEHKICPCNCPRCYSLTLLRTRNSYKCKPPKFMRQFGIDFMVQWQRWSCRCDLDSKVKWNTWYCIDCVTTAI